MGRSKFPGKPSKSINRKRISVLQIDDEGLAEQQENTADVPTNRSNRSNNNDDDDNENDTRNGGSTSNGRVADASSTDSASGSQSNQNVNGKNSENGKSSNGDSGCAGNSNSNSVTESCSESYSKTGNDALPLSDETDEKRSNDKNKEEEEKNAEENNENYTNSTNKKSLQSITTIPSSYTDVSTPIAVACGTKTCNRKFKNVNLAKADVIRPSFPKVKQKPHIKVDSSASSTGMPVGIESKAILETDADDNSMDDYSATLLVKSADSKIDTKTSDINLESSKTSNDSKNVCTTKLNVNDNTSSQNSNNCTPSSSSKVITTTKQKKTVTFKNILETSDDKSAVKKMYNPDNRRPLVSIMKKECIYRPNLYTRNSECIVRPSRLTEILKNNSNIDKLNSLKFRSSTSTTCVSSSNTTSNESSTLNSLFGGGLSRAFGAPIADEDSMHNKVTFRVKADSPTRDSKSDTSSRDNNDGSKLNDDGDGDNAEEDEDEQQMIVDKLFVLPKRSTRSSRVIKPNKRLLEDGIICKKSANKTKVNSSTTPKKDQSNYFGLREDCDNIKLNLGNKTSKELSEQKSTFALSTSQFPKYSLLKANSFVLRQPRLHVYESVSNRANTSQTTSTSPTPKSVTSKSLTQPVCSNSPLNSTSTFSLSATNSSLNSPSLSNLTSCSVCSTIIINKNLQEARKYGVLACEACRKFISKINKKSIASSGSPSKKYLQLLCKGDGNCNLLSHSKNHIRNFKRIYKERCSACWLKKCIQIFHFPSGHKLRLSSILPVNMIKQKDSLIQISTPDTCYRNDTELLSPTGLFLSQRLTSAGQIKWKSSIDIGVEMKINLKNNPLAENNVTFGTSPLLRPPILEKSIFTKSIEQQKVEKVKKLENSDLIPEDDSLKNRNKANENGQKLIKSRRKEKQDKDILNKSTTNISKYISKGITSEIINASITHSGNPLLSSAQTIPSTSTQTAADFSGPISTVTSTVSYSSNSTLTTTTASASTLADTHKRQRIDLKGPRVKHVCRSASIVLGQPLAIFDEENDLSSDQQRIDESLVVAPKITDITFCKDENYTNKQNSVIDENENCSSCRLETNSKSYCTNDSVTKQLDEITQPPSSKCSNLLDQEMTEEMNSEKGSVLHLSKIDTRNINSNCNIITINNYNNLSVQKSNTTFPSVVGKKYMNFQQHHQQHLQKRKESSKSKLLISIDFWENYDPAEVSQTGFGLIVTETVAQRALCFLCGSTGLDALIFCACCCEPYHQYCVLDEYNLKHSSLDDTIASILDTSTLMLHTNTNNMNQITNRLNWLCPRCTVCYTCNMSSGSKVKCQKCQKNYHSTCLGTSKRLLGADRPLICVNCLKCKSCSTTKVSKFVGNLPMCTSCFKLRKKGNYCPICQKCYEENDFDLKMMECGNCNQWVHSKCEGLTDEQYNLLSTLPESIEFICIKCAKQTENSKQRAYEWRQAVTEEFKTSLMSVLKLLSKSRQACALLKLSPRKKIMCTCGGNGKIQPKCLQFNNERDPMGSDGESQCSDDIYEFNENVIEDKAREKCICVNTLNSNLYNGNHFNNLSLVDIKRKIISNEYVSLAEFNYDMNNVIQIANCDELVIAYKEILSEQFPWFQNETKACTDALEEDMFESCSYIINNSLESQNFNNEHQNRSIIDLPENVDNLIYSLKTRKDMRICLFCRKTGEAESSRESRLLYCGHDCWVHTNCAMWSAEVFEEIDGSLQNVHSAISRGRKIRCTVCGNRGATVGCNVKSCGEHYHFPCARSISCSFLVDKTVFCPDHAGDASKSKTLATTETDFDVARPVYVELDRKRNKLVEPSKVQFHIGSLEVKQLGTLIPRFSDTYEAIIPINFLCSRLYWSSKEPWKIVEYTIKTTIQNSFSTLTTFDADRNFTIDHSNPNSSMVQLGLAQISLWHNSLTRGNIADNENTDIVNLRNSTLTKLLPEFLSNNQNSSSATDENNEEEPQNNADLFPPEIKDAIFEDLPHELLDGISMLDIFPKFMICEEMGNSDGKTEMFLNEQSKDSTPNTVTNSNVQISDDDTVNSAFSKQNELNNSWSSNNLIVNHVEDALLSATRSSNQIKRTFNSGDIQRNKSELLKRTPQQRTWSKIDGNSAAAAIKRRKFSKNLQEMRVTEGVLFSINQQRSKKDAATVQALSRRQSQSNDVEMNNTLRTKQFIWSAAKHIETKLNIERDDKIKLMQVDGVDDSITEYRIFSTDTQFNGTVKCDRCHCTYRTYESFQRHIANCEPLSTSESESETTPRTPELAACQMISTDAISELNKLNQGHRTATLTNVAGNLPFIQTFSQAVPINNIQTSINSIPLTNMSNIQNVQGLQNIQGLQNLQSLQNIQIQNIQPQAIGSNFFISHSHPTTSNSDDIQYFPNSLQGLTSNLNGTYTIAPTNTFGAAAIQPAQQQQTQLIAVSTNPDGSQQIIQLPPVSSQNSQILQNTGAFQTLQTSNDKKIILPLGGKSIKALGIKGSQQLATSLKGKIKSNNVIKPIQTKVSAPNTTVAQQTIQAQQTPMTVLNTGAVGQNTAQLLNNSIMQQMQAASMSSSTQQPQILFQTANTTTQHQPIIMQQVGTAPNSTVPQNIISFVTTDGTQNPQVQYLSLPPGNDFKTQTQTTPFITATNTNPQIMQGAFIQTDASGNLVLTTSQAPTGLQMLSATPLNITQATQPQPQVIGTLIQPQTIQLGGNVITPADPPQQQVILGGGTSGLEMLAAANATAPQVILATQPMYYGLETIVQNTVMSSQQFVSTAMPGVLSQNASFSATTTQVFQASKIEPIVDIPTGYVVLNNVDTGASIVQQQGAQQTNYLNSTTNVLQQPQSIHNAHQSTTATEIQNNNIADQQHSIYRIQTSNDNSNFSYHNQQSQQFIEQTVNQQQPTVQIVTAKVPPVSQIKRNTGKATPIAAVTKVQPQVINKVVPTTNNKLNNNKQINQHSRIPSQIIVDSGHIAKAQTQIKTSINTNINNCNLLKAHQNVDTQQIFTTPCVTTVPATIATKPLQIATTTKKTNFIRPIHKAEVKPKIIKTATISKPNLQRQTLQQQQQQQQEMQHQQQQQIIQSINDNSKNVLLKPIQDTQNIQQAEVNTIETNKNLESKPVSNQQYQQLNEFINEAEEYSFGVAVQNPTDLQIESHSKTINESIINNPYDFSQHQQQSECQIMQQQKCYNTEITKDQAEIFNQHQQEMNAIATNSINQNRSQYCNSTFNANVPTNIVNPLQQSTQYTIATTTANNIHPNSTTLISRPTNRVLPMQQNPNQTTTTSTVKTVAKTINDVSKLYNDITSKVCYESEVKKNEDSLLQIQMNSPHLQSPHQIFHIHEQNDNGTFNKSVSVTEFVDNTLKCDIEAMENETSLTTQQIEIVANDLQDYAANCLLISEKDKIPSTIVSQNFSVIDCSAGSENMNVIEQDDDDDDDGFSIKMPTEEMSDSDEPTVKAKISKILDNLTNDDCNDSIVAVTTVETCAELSNVKYINSQICENNTLQSTTTEEANFDNENVSEAIAAAANNLMTQTDNDINVDISQQIDDTGFDLKKIQVKLSPHLKSNKVPVTIIDNDSNISNGSTTKMDEINSLKTETQFPPPYPSREPKKITGPHLLYEIQSEDGFIYKSTSITEIWEQVFEAVQVARRAHGLVPLPEGPLADMCGVQMIGLKTNALKYLIEQLPGVEKCQKYTPKYHKYDSLLSQSVAFPAASTISSISANGISSTNDINSTIDYLSDQEDLQENLFGSARLEPFSKRSDYDMFSWLASRHRKQPIQVFLQPSDNELIPRRGTGSNLPMAMKYRTLKETYKDYVGVFRSHIHGRGLYCTKDIEAGEMVIEYAGELIRSTLTDKRERCYNSRGIGCYMFKIDENLVVDATMRGNAARFINHSCEPNCYSKVVDILGHKHIIIFALRRIVQGEELTYDYKFPFEDEKIPCSCGSKKCRKYLN